jgi:uncharacterized membrane protein HdeD (DUF308 family)
MTEPLVTGPARGPDAADDAVRRLSGINGFAALAIGVILLVWSERTVAVVAVLLGIWLIFSATVQLVQALRPSRDESETSRTAELISAVVYLITGVFCLRHPFETVTFLAVLVGVALIVFGAMSIFGSQQRQSGRHRVAQLAIGVITATGGLIVVIWPSLTVTGLADITGVLLIVLGVVQLYLAYRARSRVSGSAPA